MNKKIQWYDVKTKFKQLIRKILYSLVFQELICLAILLYMKLVYVSSRKKFINREVLIQAAKTQSPLIISFWHNRLMMIPFITLKPRKLFPNYKIATLSSNHGDGKFVGKVMKKFGFLLIEGSSKNNRKASRGIDISNLKKIFQYLKQGFAIGMTPDGPRGPAQKINGEMINIARISGAGILPVSYASSKFIMINSWDKFKIPLPFGKICFYYDSVIFHIEKSADENQILEMKNKMEKRMDEIQAKADAEISS